ncbi:hypothetical protein [Actinomyces dentalis]|uniref:hypothetical protein n=1 Tax=Actinomyces dentalis TaxID=272548 RepID=UPI00047D32F0|nr:hypothetical protein [Actinomyces dentalis]
MPPSGGFFAVSLRFSSSAASAPVFLGSYQHAGFTEAPPDDEDVVVPPSDPPDADVVVTSNENATT